MIQVKNTGTRQEKGNLFVALRPFQVLPPWQDLNITGGVSPIHTIERNDRSIIIHGSRVVYSLSAVEGFGAAEFGQGDITSFLNADALPNAEWDSLMR